MDYVDTHLKTIIHPAGPVASAILAICEMQPVSGKDFLNALVLGVETECRIGNSALLDLSAQQMVWALGLAASQPVGLRESFGSMNKSFNPGRAASNGIFAALLPSKNFTSSDGMIEAKRGWASTISTKQDYKEITDGLGQRYEAALNTYKPFACGIVLHPAIDTAIRLRDENKLTADQIERVELKVHPLVLELTGKNSPCFSLSSDIGVLNDYALDLVERNLIAGPIVEFRRTRPFVRRHCLAAFEGTAVVEIGCDPRCAERVTADFGVEAGVPHAPADHAPGVDAVHRRTGQLARAAARGAEQGSPLCVRDPGGLKIGVEIGFEIGGRASNGTCRLSREARPPALALSEVVFDARRHGGAHAREGIGHQRDRSAVAQPDDSRSTRDAFRRQAEGCRRAR